MRLRCINIFTTTLICYGHPAQIMLRVYLRHSLPKQLPFCQHFLLHPFLFYFHLTFQPSLPLHPLESATELSSHITSLPRETPITEPLGQVHPWYRGLRTLRAVAHNSLVHAQYCAFFIQPQILHILYINFAGKGGRLEIKFGKSQICKFADLIFFLDLQTFSKCGSLRICDMRAIYSFRFTNLRI